MRTAYCILLITLVALLLILKSRSKEPALDLCASVVRNEIAVRREISHAVNQPGNDGRIQSVATNATSVSVIESSVIMDIDEDTGEKIREFSADAFSVLPPGGPEGVALEAVSSLIVSKKSEEPGDDRRESSPLGLNAIRVALYRSSDNNVDRVRVSYLDGSQALCHTWVCLTQNEGESWKLVSMSGFEW